MPLRAQLGVSCVCHYEGAAKIVFLFSVAGAAADAPAVLTAPLGVPGMADIRPGFA